jgi:tetratricopeptide (TPR) repeat protein
MGRFEQTVQARPAFAPAHNEMGKVLLEREEYDAAIDHFVKAIGSDPRAEYARGLQVAMTRKTKKQSGLGGGHSFPPPGVEPGMSPSVTPAGPGSAR